MIYRIREEEGSSVPTFFCSRLFSLTFMDGFRGVWRLHTSTLQYHWLTMSSLVGSRELQCYLQRQGRILEFLRVETFVVKAALKV